MKFTIVLAVILLLLAVGMGCERADSYDIDKEIGINGGELRK